MAFDCEFCSNCHLFRWSENHILGISTGLSHCYRISSAWSFDCTFDILRNNLIEPRKTAISIHWIEECFVKFLAITAVKFLSMHTAVHPAWQFKNRLSRDASNGKLSQLALSNRSAMQNSWTYLITIVCIFQH